VSDKEIELLLLKFNALGGAKIILNGFPKYFTTVVEIANSIGLDVSVVLHGGLSEFAEKSIEDISLGYILKLFKENKIKRVAVIKKGLDKIILGITGK